MFSALLTPLPLMINTIQAKGDVKVGYHPNKSHVSDTALAKFIHAEITGNLVEVI
jgi:hypothetical protein